MQFKVCPDCGANLDPGEVCDCSAPKLRVSTTLVVDVDIAKNGEAALAVRELYGRDIIKTITGPTAKMIYKKLTEKEEAKL